MTSQPSPQPSFSPRRPLADRPGRPASPAVARVVGPALSVLESIRDEPQSAPPRPCAGEGGSAAVQRWMREWQTWQDRPGTRAALVRWQAQPCLAGLGVLHGSDALEAVLAACGRDVTVPKRMADVRLASVVAEALGGDQVATRLVLQRVFPALVQRAASRARLHQLAFRSVLDDLMAQAWLVISEYPLQARPTKIAVNIIRDAEYRLFGYVPVTEGNTLPVAPGRLPSTLGRAAVRGPGEPERVLGGLPAMLLDEVSAGFPMQDARLLTQVYLLGLSTTEIAAAECVSTRCVRYRKQRALWRLAAHLGYPPSATGPARPRRTAAATRTTTRATSRATAGAVPGGVVGPEGGTQMSGQVPGGDVT